MSTHIASDVWKYSQAHGAALLVLVSLADQANDAGECWPSVESIAARCRVSVRSMHRYLDHLVALSERERVQRLGRSSAYVVHPLGDAATPANLADPTPANLAQGSATAGRQNHHLTKDQEEPSSSTTAAAVPDKDAPGAREDVDRLCKHLASRIEDNGSPRPRSPRPGAPTPGYCSTATGGPPTRPTSSLTGARTTHFGAPTSS